MKAEYTVEIELKKTGDLMQYNHVQPHDYSKKKKKKTIYSELWAGDKHSLDTGHYFCYNDFMGAWKTNEQTN